MARGIARIRGETNIRTLAARLFDLSGPDGEAKARMAEKALMSANPALRSADGFTDDRIVIVPSVGLDAKKDVERPAADLDGLLRETARRLDQTASGASTSLQRSVKEAGEALHRLNDDKFVEELVAKSPEQGTKLVEQAKIAINDRAKADKTRQREVKEMLEAAIAEIDGLRKIAKGKNDKGKYDGSDGGGGDDGGRDDDGGGSRRGGIDRGPRNEGGGRDDPDRIRDPRRGRAFRPRRR